MVFYPIPLQCGLESVTSLNDGYTINVRWFQAYPTVLSNRIAYNIYYSTIKENVYTEGAKYVSIDDSIEANIIGLTPGQLYFIYIRPIEYNPNLYDLENILPIAYDNLRFYPYSLLRQNISAIDLTLPLVDTVDFPAGGVVRVGAEAIQYSSISGNDLIVDGDTPGGAYFISPYPYYTTPATNFGDGYLLAVTLLTGAVAETWTVRCVSDGYDSDGYINGVEIVPSYLLNDYFAGIAKFIALGSISGCKRDGYGDPYIWLANGQTVSNVILRFSVWEGTRFFKKGDEFIIRVGMLNLVPGGRGFLNTTARSHNTDGYDGYYTWDPTVMLFVPGEDKSFDKLFLCQSRFEYSNFQVTAADGYHQVIKDLLTTDLSASDEFNVDFPAYDYAGYHRTDPVQLLNGTCVGSYIGGEMGCIDKYGNVHMLRGMSLQDQNNQRQEILLSVTGRPAVLLKRRRTGITCSCYQPSSEYPDDRCPVCGGGKIVISFEQYFNPRRSDGRILVRCGPADEDLKMTEAGLESDFILDFWTLTVPTIKDRDIVILFDQDDNEEYRYEVLSVTRNNTIVGLQGGQKFKGQRIRKFDPAYQIRAFKNTAEFPSTLNTGIGFTTHILPHTHTIVTNEHITLLSQINQTTSVAQGHNHEVISGVVSTVLSHTHTIILP